MKYRDLFPYTHRKLGLQDHKVPKDDFQHMEKANLVKIALANLSAGESFSDADGVDFLVKQTGEKVDDTLTIMKQGEEIFSGRVDDEGLKALCEELSYLFDHEEESKRPVHFPGLVKAFESDPAGFRSRAGGWVIIDDLVPYSGNVTYPSWVDGNKKEAIEENTTDETAVEQDDFELESPPFPQASVETEQLSLCF